MVKVKTLVDNVRTLNKKGTILETTKKQAEKWEKLGVVEIVKTKQAPKKQAPKKQTPKKEEPKTKGEENKGGDN